MNSGRNQNKPTSPRRERAIAVQYHDLNELPAVTATGVGEIAKKIIALAKEHNIPIEQNDSLAEMLSAVQVGDSITPQSFKLVAEIIAFLYHLDKEWRETHSFLDAVTES
jgi:flagellar biosynthesis protein